MNIDHLREFVYLCESLSFSATAKHFYLSQSVLSKHIASMEEELGAQLFIRDSRHVHATQSGKIFYDDACTIVAEYKNALQRVAALNESYNSFIRIGYLRNASRPFLGMFLHLMRKHHPDTKIRLTCYEFGELNSALVMKKIDMAFTMDISASLRKIGNTFPVYKDRFYVVTSAARPLLDPSNGTITSEMLSGIKILLPDPLSYLDMSDFISTFVPPKKSDDPPRRHYSDVDTLFLSIETEDCIGFSSGHNIPMFKDFANFLCISDKDTSYDVSALWLKDSRATGIPACLEMLEKCRNKVAVRIKTCD